MMKYVKRFANIVSIIIVFVFLPITLMSDYSAQRGLFASRQGPDTSFSKDCVCRYFPGINDYVERVYCKSTRWIDTSARIMFKVKNEDALENILDNFVSDTSYDQGIFIGCETPAWWRISAEGEKLKKYVPKEESANTSKSLWLNRKHGEIIILYEYFTM